MPALRVAVIGAGAFGRNHLRVYRELELAHPDLVQLAALVEPDHERRNTFAATYNIPAFATVAELLQASASNRPASKGTGFSPSMNATGSQAALAPERLASGAPEPALSVSTAPASATSPNPGAPCPASGTWVDAASICVPTIHHAQVAEQLLHAGIDLLIEKPFAATLAEADHLIALAKQRGRILAIGHLERFNPAVTATVAALNHPMFFEAHRLSIFTPRSLDVDVVLDLMIHDLDIVLALAQSPVKEVRAVGLPILSRKTDIANVRVEFDSGCVANFTASRVSTEQVRKLRLFQPHQYLSLDFARQELLTISVDPTLIAAMPTQTLSSRPEAALFAAAVERPAASPGSPLPSAHPTPGLNLTRSEIPKAEPLRLELEDFLHAVRNRAQPRVPAEAGRAALSLALTINQQIAAHAHQTGLL